MSFRVVSNSLNESSFVAIRVFQVFWDDLGIARKVRKRNGRRNVTHRDNCVPHYSSRAFKLFRNFQIFRDLAATPDDDEIEGFRLTSQTGGGPLFGDNNIHMVSRVPEEDGLENIESTSPDTEERHPESHLMNIG